MNIENKIKELGIDLPASSAPKAMYVASKKIGNLVYVSGQLPMIDGKMLYPGHLGKEVTLEQGQEAARACAINIMAVVKGEIGDLDKVKQFVKLQGYVSSTDDFTDQHLVVNGASQLLFDVFGEAGRHTRSVIGLNTLALNACVEIDAIVEVED